MTNSHKLKAATIAAAEILQFYMKEEKLALHQPIKIW